MNTKTTCAVSTGLLRLLAAVFALLCTSQLFGTHNRAGGIHVQQLGPLTIRATIITWTKTSSFNVDRDTLDINWGDGIIEIVEYVGTLHGMIWCGV